MEFLCLGAIHCNFVCWQTLTSLSKNITWAIKYVQICAPAIQPEYNSTAISVTFDAIMWLNVFFFIYDNVIGRKQSTNKKMFQLNGRNWGRGALNRCTFKVLNFGKMMCNVKFDTNFFAGVRKRARDNETWPRNANVV